MSTSQLQRREYDVEENVNSKRFRKILEIFQTLRGWIYLVNMISKSDIARDIVEPIVKYGDEVYGSLEKICLSPKAMLNMGERYLGAVLTYLSKDFALRAYNIVDPYGVFADRYSDSAPESIDYRIKLVKDIYVKMGDTEFVNPQYDTVKKLVSPKTLVCVNRNLEKIIVAITGFHMTTRIEGDDV